jgi:hypothetical protein
VLCAGSRGFVAGIVTGLSGSTLRDRTCTASDLARRRIRPESLLGLDVLLRIFDGLMQLV